jgi:hypothetical protein
MYQIGVDIGGTSIKIGLVNEDLQIVSRSSIPFPHVGGEGVAAALAAAVRELLGTGMLFAASDGTGGLRIFGEWFTPVTIFLLPSGAFLTLGFLIALVQKITATSVERKRVHELELDALDAGYHKTLMRDPETGKCLPEHNWLWAPTGVYDAHMPEMWGYLIFTESGEEHPLPAEDEAKLVLRRLYYRQHAYGCAHGAFCTDAAALLGEEAARWGVKTYATPSMFEGILEWNGRTFHIDQDGYLWEGDKY